MRKGWLAGLLLLAGVFSFSAQETTVRNPYTSPVDVAAGARMYRPYCARCHGLSAEGDRGPALNRSEFRYGSSDAALFRTLSLGIPGSIMPALNLPEQHIWQLVAFVRSLAARPVEVKLRGDPKVGKELFYGTGGCNKCHMINGDGGRKGPDLSDIGWMRSTEHLRASILQPNDHLESRYWPIEIETSEGDIIEGFRLSEDNYSIEILDVEENLRSFWKSELREIRERKTSTMPVNIEETLNSLEIDHLVAFLYSLRRKGTTLE